MEFVCRRRKGKELNKFSSGVAGEEVKVVISVCVFEREIQLLKVCP
jgi:hypothetical protein